MSKRIMDCVFDVSNDCGVKIYYQGTDSSHLNYDDVDEIVKRYKENPKLYLVGESLGNFHVDFPQRKGYKEVYSIEGLFLSKKSYSDLLWYVNVNDKEQKIRDNLARMKGFPTPCIEYYAKENKCPHQMFIKSCMIIDLSILI